jgi:hypothetical protein
MGTILLHSLGYTQDFVKYIKQFKVINQNESFLLYLKAVAYLFDKDFKFAKQYALQAILLGDIANDYQLFGLKSQATKFLEQAIYYVKDDKLKQEVNRFFEEEIKTQLVLN